MSMKYAIFLIQEALVEWFPRPTSYKSKGLEFQVQSYHHLAICELLNYLYPRQDCPVIETIESFRAKFSDYAEKSHSEDQHFLFCTGYDAISYILDYLRNVEE